MQLKTKEIKSNKTGKTYTAYYFQVGEYESPIFFPSKVELYYLKNYIRNLSHKQFQEDDIEDFDNEEDE